MRNLPEMSTMPGEAVVAGDETVAVVHTEACVAFVGDNEAPGGVCVACGWLLDEHDDLFAFLAHDTPAAA